MYNWVVYLHVAVIFIFLVQHGPEILVSFKLREQTQPEEVFAVFGFMSATNRRNLRITYSFIILTGLAAGFISTWWKQGWMWAALGIMVIIWIIMSRFGTGYLIAVEAITSKALKNRDDISAVDTFRRDLKARREPEIMVITMVLGGGIILWLMLFKPF